MNFKVKSRHLPLIVLMLAVTFVLVGGIARSYTSSVPVSLTVPNSSLEVSGYGAPGALITIYDGSTPAATTIVGPNGQFFKTLPTVAAGLRSISISQKDLNGVESSTVNRVINIPPQQLTQAEFIVPPTISISNNNISEGDEIDLVGFSMPNIAVDFYLDNQANLYKSVTTDSAGKYKLTLSTAGFSSGSHNIKARYQSPSALSEFSKILVFKVSPLPQPETSTNQPAINIGTQQQKPRTPSVDNPPNMAQVNGDKITISGQADPNIQVVISINNSVVGSVFSDSLGYWYFDYYPQAAKNIITVVSCIQSMCSGPSEPIEVFYNVKGEVLCRDEFYLQEYRFYTKENNKVSLETVFQQQKPRTLIIDWGDGVVERFSVNSSDKDGNYEHKYQDIGNYNGVVSSTYEGENCYGQKFFSVQVTKNNKDLLYVFLFIMFGSLLTILVVSMAYKVNAQIKENQKSSKDL